jgi:predicted phosphoadenosine phosphosulfate sulfurtransferase
MFFWLEIKRLLFFFKKINFFFIIFTEGKDFDVLFIVYRYYYNKMMDFRLKILYADISQNLLKPKLHLL